MLRLSHTDFVNKVKKIHGDNLIFLENYTSGCVKIKTLCRLCNNSWSANPRPLYYGVGCPKCGLKKAANTLKWRITTVDFIKKVKKIHKDKFEILSDYTNVRSKIKVKCHSCCKIFLTISLNLLKKAHHGKKSSGCTFCGRIKKGLNSRKSSSSFNKEIKKINPDILLLGRYKTGRNNIKVKCKKCGYVWKPRATSLRRRGCPQCASSKAEKKIELIFKKEKINFKPQYTFKDLKGQGGGSLRFDFAVFRNKKLSHLIEYDGEQHFKEIKFMGGKKRLITQKKNDLIKNRYCLKNKIKLIRLKQLNLEEITIERLM